MRGSTQKSPSRAQKFNFLKKERKANSQNGKFLNFFHNGEQIFLKKIIWSKLIQTFFLKIRFRKRTHVFDNTMISLRKLSFLLKDSVTVIKTQNRTTRQNSWSYVTIRELQARKHNQISAIISLLRKTRFRKEKISCYQNWDIWVFLKQKSVSKTLNLWKQPKGHEISRKIVKKEVTGH